MCILFAIRSISGLPNNCIKITFLDVGQGAGAFIKYNNDTGIMIDCGSTDKNELLDYTILPFLKSEGISKIKYWFLSHSDIDHASGLLEYLKNYNNSMPKIQTIVTPYFHLKSNIYEKVKEYCKSLKIRRLEILSGDSFKFTDDYKKPMTLTCLSPFNNCNLKDHNEESEVLLLSYGHFQALFLGDMPKTMDKNIIKFLSTNKLCDDCLEIIQASHHGSKSGTSDELLTCTSPLYAIISAGKNNSYSHPHKELINRLNSHNIKHYKTFESGAIIIKATENEMSISHMK